MSVSTSKQQKKTLVLDTNVILHSPKALNSFGKNIILISLTVLEELDNFKKGNSVINRNARIAIRRMDSLRKKGDLTKGVKLPNGGTLKIFVNHTKEIKKQLFNLNLEDTPDNRIISVASYLSDKKTGEVIFVSKDINARLKAHALGIKVEDFEKESFQEKNSSLDQKTVLIKSDKMDEFHEKKQINLDGENFYPNEFVILKNSSNQQSSGIGCFQNGVLKKPHLPKRLEPIFLRNKEQRMAGSILLNKEITAVTLIGGPGTGKTMLALAAGIKSWQKGDYERILVARPIIPMGKDIGYLPGSKDNKLQYWMQPIFDNLNYLLRLMSLVNKTKTVSDLEQKFNEKEICVSSESLFTASSLIKEGVISLEPLTYIRGRSIPNSFIIIDDTQNLTPHEIKTVITRAGEGTKVVFTGDPNQIDNPYLDSRNNGLVYLANKARGLEIAGHVFLSKSERSFMSEAFSKIL